MKNIFQYILFSKNQSIIIQYQNFNLKTMAKKMFLVSKFHNKVEEKGGKYNK